MKRRTTGGFRSAERTRYECVILLLMSACAGLLHAAAAQSLGIPIDMPGAHSATAPAPRAGAARVLETGQTPPALLELIDSAGTGDDYPDAAMVTLFDSTRVAVEESGLSHRRQHTLRKVLTAAGARDAASLRFDYDPASNQIEILSVRIHHADSTFAAVDPASAVDAAAPAHMIYWGARMKVLALPRLEAGDAVEVVTEKMGYQIAYLEEIEADLERYVPPMRGHFYDVIQFQHAEPSKCIHYRLVLPRDKPAQYTVYNGEVFSALSFSDSTLVYDWWSTEQPAVTEEPFEPDRSDFVTKVVLATVPDWAAKSRWFYEVNDPVFAWSDEIQQKVNELTRGLKTDDQRMAVLLHWVADNIRYSGLSMGEGEGYTLHPGIMTWEERCGVCKDIAGMLVTMLRAAGYTTYPVMTMAGARVEDVPADQFNHCVVAVREPDGSYVMLDPTWAPQSREIWSHAEGEQHYVIGSPEGDELRAMRSFTPEENQLRARFRTALDAAGTLTGELELDGTGYMDTRLRGNLTYRTRADWATFAGDILAGISPALEVTSAEFGDYRDYSRPMRYRFAFRAPGYAAVSDSAADLALPSARFLANSRRFVRIVDLPEVEDRTHPALFWSTAQAEVSETLSLPKGLAPQGALPRQALDRDAAAYRGSVAGSPGTLAVEQQLLLKKRTVPPKEWTGVAEVSDSLESFAETRVHAVRK